MQQGNDGQTNPGQSAKQSKKREKTAASKLQVEGKEASRPHAFLPTAPSTGELVPVSNFGSPKEWLEAQSC